MSDIKSFYSKIIILLSVILISGCASIVSMGGEGAWARATLKRLTLREKIAQMMLARMNMRYLNSHQHQWQRLSEQIKAEGIGGVHLWYGDAGTSLTLMNRMQKMSRIPILFDADFERGVGQRFPGGTELPPNMAIAATGDPANAYLAARITALEARAVGVALNLGPVVDVNNNPANPIINVRSYSEDPAMVSRFALEYIRGLQDHGVLATAKHFPGHGDTETDSHSSLASIPSDRDRLYTVELAPFKAAMDAGVDLIMTSHLQAIDFQPHAGTPATMSPFWTTQILKEELGFTGAVITDAMGMGGITQNFTDAYALVEAINAGADIIIQNYDFKQAIDVVEEAVLNGRISEDRIDEAALKMLLLKEQVGLHKRRLLDMDETRSVLGSVEFKQAARELAAEAITLVRNVSGQIPLRYTQEDDSLVVIDLYDYDFNHSLSTVTRGLLRSGLPLKAIQLDTSDPDFVYAAVLDSIADSSRVVINVFANISVSKDRVFPPQAQLDFLAEIVERFPQSIIVSLGTPYLIQEVPEAGAYLVCYNGTQIMQAAVVQAIVGNAPIAGKLPITIPGVAALGAGLVIAADSLVIPDESAEEAALAEAGLLPDDIVLKRAIPYEIDADVSALERLLAEATADSAWPGGVLLAARAGKIFVHQSFGYHTYAREQATHRGDIFDLASMTKVVATTSAIMKLYEDSSLTLDAAVTDFLPQFSGPTRDQTALKKSVTIRHLLTHTSGLPPFRLFYKMEGSISQRLDSVFATPLDTIPGSRYVYSDIGLIILGKLVEQVAGVTMDAFVDTALFQPLGMASTYFNPPAERSARFVPTEFDSAVGAFIIGHVHDENAYSLGGVAGHAGLFSTAADLAKFGQMMLNRGIYADTVIFQPATVDLFTRRAEMIPGNSRCLGWDSPHGESSAGIYAASASFGHTGFTGTSMWIDPENELLVILLTNAVHPDREWKYPRYFDWRQRIHSAVYECFDDMRPNPELSWRARWTE